jgi:uncharacterized protein (DUF111 family)
MKKNRPGHIFKILVSQAKTAEIEDLLFSELPTLGIRKQLVQRSILERQKVNVQTEFGTVAAKQISETDGSNRIEPEFDERIRLAMKHNKPLRKLKID